MAHTSNRLTARAVEAATYKGRDYKLSDGRGLWLFVTKPGRYWRLRYRIGGKERLMSLGVYPDVSLKKARDRREATRKLIADGVDPVAVRRAQAASRTGADRFEAIAYEWLDTQRKTLKADTLRLARRRLEVWAFPAIGHKPVDQIEPPDVLKLLRPIERKGKHETAHRVRQRIGQVMRYAIVTGRATRDPTADLKDALAPIPTTHRAAITDPEGVARLMAAIEGYDGQPATNAALRLLALTFVRSSELRRATWDEFDLDAALWRLPASRMKAKRDHLVPLSKQAIEVLADLYPITGHRPYVFEAIRRDRPLSDNTLNLALKAIGYDSATMTPHGFRAMASTLLHEQGWPPEVIELQLAHAQRSQVAAAYNRSARLEQRKAMMQSWADYLEGLQRGKVVAIR